MVWRGEVLWLGLWWILALVGSVAALVAASWTWTVLETWGDGVHHGWIVDDGTSRPRGSGITSGRALMGISIALNAAYLLGQIALWIRATRVAPDDLGRRGATHMHWLTTCVAAAVTLATHAVTWDMLDRWPALRAEGDIGTYPHPPAPGENYIITGPRAEAVRGLALAAIVAQVVSLTVIGLLGAAYFHMGTKRPMPPWLSSLFDRHSLIPLHCTWHNGECR